ncbi:hypothetical protein [Flavobacterium crassostreae]|uniref:Uncharacterized protein n=1 Tax=Flavobacterium crassostreae TaxID=1763534 RepID=A0A1B9E0K4_9FLAO|nr:hypothetical protein [Flavobacterium crassostreae]OCB75459.1 hypothetical protein LPBF_07570 [Flavobacterium crassostreae]
MKKRYLYIVGILLTMAIQPSFAQKYKFKTSGFSVLQKDQRGKWGNWSELDLVAISIHLDTDKNRFVVYLPLIQVYDIVAYQPSSENDTDLVYSFSCKDASSALCTLSIITRKKQDNRKQLYITSEDKIIVYNIVNAM